MAFALKLGDGIESSNQVKYYGVMGDPGAHYKPVKSTGTCMVFVPMSTLEDKG